ncbi:RAVE protein 1 C terminal-domain-containing protein [Coniella lustricola]|uniref:RAVE protein 1 C terminal-domain-containing protein n=1 Tax=Coniella lustricola TaxID=2025994 RepID=A0A2T3AIY5_9PEZI|nr:RAVE protein 1 C terminal-domain-containing protein [Coniella lustricola]
MKVILPGKPEARLQALATGFWDSRRIIAYISGNAIAILSDHETLLQTIYDDDDQPLEAVSLDEASGKLAVCTDKTVRVYRPFLHGDGDLKWALETSFSPEVDTEANHSNFHGEEDDKAAHNAMAVSWGGSGELLVSRSAITLYQTIPDLACTWRKALAGPVKYSCLSYDSAYVASVGYRDRLVKVWRRLSYVSDEVRFDFMYLPHPQPVTSLQWRRPYHVDETVDNVLYTFCLDNVLRIWTGSDSHSHQQLTLWGEIDLAVQGVPQGPLWATIVHGRDISAATETAVSEGPAEYGKGDAPLANVVELANRNPEVCVVFDGHGKMSAWAMEDVTAKPHAEPKKNKPVATFPIVRAVASDDLKFLSPAQAPSSHVEISTYCNQPGGHLNFLLHFLDGRIEFYEANISRFLDANATTNRLRRRAVWSGHSASIVKMVRNYSGRAVVSRTRDGESVLWKHALYTEKTRFTRQSTISSKDHIHRIAVVRKGRFVIFLHHDRIALWDCRHASPSLLAECAYDIPGKPLCLLVLPRRSAGQVSVAHIATITSKKIGLVWEFKLPLYDSTGAVNGAKANDHADGPSDPSIREHSRFELEDAGDLSYVLPVDPAGSAPVISGFLDVFARDVAMSYTKDGRVDFWTARTGEEKVDWLATASMETGVTEPALASGSTMKKVALVNSTRTAVTIWDIRGARLEYNQEFEAQNAIQDLDWTSTPDSQSILAVGFPSRVLLLSQLRFDYMNKGPAWAPIREISVRDFTPHPIGDSTWLGDGHLVIGAGNQLFVIDRTFDAPDSLIHSISLPHEQDEKRDLFDLVQRLNGPLSVFHPQFLSQCMLAGKASLTRRILMALHKTLKFWIQGEPIDDYLGLDMEEFYSNAEPQARAGHGKDSTSYFEGRQDAIDEDDEVFSEDVSQTINEKLMNVALPQLSGHEQFQLVDIIECLGMVEKHRRSMDENGARFMLFYRQHALRKRRTNEISMSWREINWAYHSTSQDILTDFVTRQHQGSLLWEHARESGMFMWLADNAAVKMHFEAIARNEYTKSEVKNPVECSLFYLALRKKTVLQGLWRMASWNREQSATLKLLANNFEDPKWKTSALKNAYALLSKRRFEYSAAFFLLADHLQDAVNVCLNQLKDLQLAIAIARVYEGDNGPVLRKLLQEEVLNIAAQEGNRWLASWAFWMLRRRDMAVRALITPVYTLIETPHAANLQSKLFLTDDPALIVLYAQLRQKTLQTLRGASKVTPKVEWEFVLHNARLYDRMGCDLLGLDLVRNWEFLLPGSSIATGLGGEIVNPLKMLRRRSSLVVQDMPLSPLSPMAPFGNSKFQGLEMRTGREGGVGVLEEEEPGQPGQQQQQEEEEAADQMMMKMMKKKTTTGDKVQAQPPPTMFEEPDANSLLDSFGF